MRSGAISNHDLHLLRISHSGSVSKSGLGSLFMNHLSEPSRVAASNRIGRSRRRDHIRLSLEGPIVQIEILSFIRVSKLCG